MGVGVELRAPGKALHCYLDLVFTRGMFVIVALLHRCLFTKQDVLPCFYFTQV